MKVVVCFCLLFLFSNPAAFPADSVVVFNEVMYHPADADEAGLEWVELRNQLTLDVDLSAWTISGGIAFTFAEGTIIPGRGYLVVASNPGTLAAHGFAGALGPFAGRLGNDGDRLELRDRNGRLMDVLNYKDDGKWPVAPDGSGVALAKRDEETASGSAQHWVSGMVVGGTPGRRNFPDPGAMDRTQTLIAMNASWRYDASGADLGAAWRSPGFDDTIWSGDSAPNLLNYWPFDGDATGWRGGNGSLINGVSSTTDRNGVANKALAFNGAALQYVQVSGGGGLNGRSQGSISLWVKWSGLQDPDCCGTFGALLARQYDGNFSDNILALNGANPATARIVWRQSGSPGAVLLTSTGPAGTAWRHLAVTFASSGSVFYVDGVAQGSGLGAALHNNTATPLSIGAWSGDGSGFATAALDDVAIWDAPLSAGQVAQLASGARGPPAFDGAGFALYSAGTGTVMNASYPLGAQLPGGPITYYFRHKFVFNGDTALTDLKLTTVVDDGAVFYLNGTEVYRTNLPTGVVNASTLAQFEIGRAPVVSNIPLPSSLLAAGTNVLAVEVHEVAPHDSDMVFGASLTATIHPPSASHFVDRGIVFNEVTPGGNLFEVELFNRGTQSVNLAEFVIARSGRIPAQRVLAPLTLEPGDFLSLDQTALGFNVRSADRLYLFAPDLQSLLDAVEIKVSSRARFPDGLGDWLRPSVATLGASNQFQFHRDIVINEILYHAPATPAGPHSIYAKSSEQWIELWNRGTGTVSLTGWRLDAALDYVFPAGTEMSPGAYLVIANDPVELLSRFPGLPVLGPFTNILSRREDRVVLRDAQDNPASEVHYFDGGRWPEAADGGGSSLELRNPFSEPAVAENWGASQEGSQSSWRSYTNRMVCQASAFGADAWNELDIGLLGAGEVLLDDIHIIEYPDGVRREFLQNPTFTPGTNKWRFLGNHQGSTILDPANGANTVLRLQATGPTDSMHNHAETTFANNLSPANGIEYEIRFRAKWISGSRQLLTRAFLSRLQALTILDAPARHGTPGAINSTYAANVGPAFKDLRHEPVVPAPGQPTAISVRVEDPEDVANVALWWRVGTSAWTPQTMNFSNGFYMAAVPGQSAGTIVQFHVIAADAQGAEAHFPALGTNGPALYQVNDGLAAANGLSTFRLILAPASSNLLFGSATLMSNERLPCTVILDEREVIHNAGLRLKGSEHSRVRAQRMGFLVEFPSENSYHGIHRSLMLDRSQCDETGQLELLVNQVMNHAGGLPTKYHDFVQVLAPRRDLTGPAELQLARYGNVFLEDQFVDGGDGTAFEYEIYYGYATTDTGGPEGNKLPGQDIILLPPMRNLGPDQEQWRWSYLIKNNEERDDYAPLMTAVNAVSAGGPDYLARVSAAIDLDQWLRSFALAALVGAGDNWGGNTGFAGAPHNAYFYIRPIDRRLLYFPYDMDCIPGETTGHFAENPVLQSFLTYPAQARRYYGHLRDIVNTSFKGSYLSRWANQLAALAPGQPFVAYLPAVEARGQWMLSQINALAPPALLSITTSNGQNFLIASNRVTLQGTAPLDASELRLTDSSGPLAVDWITSTIWRTTLPVPLSLGANSLILQAIGYNGQVLSNVSITITATQPGGALDSDHDGMPDRWEVLYGLDPARNDAEEDADGDGQRNLEEYFAGSDPGSPSSRLQAQLTRESGAVRLTFEAMAGRSYGLDHRNSLASGTWMRLMTFLPQMSNRLEQISLPLPAGTGGKFFRVATPSAPY